MADQQRDHQAGISVRKVDRPGDLVPQFKDVREEIQQLRLVVHHPAGEELVALTVDDHAMVVALARIDPGPYPAHHSPDAVVVYFGSDGLASGVLRSDSDRKSQ